MKKIPFLLTMLLLTSIGIVAQLHLPTTIIDSSGNLNVKDQNISGKADKFKSTSDLQWFTLPSITDEVVLQASIACDGSEMVIFYREPDYSINTDPGIIKKWDEDHWVDYAGITAQCHTPDIDIDGTIMSASWYTDAYDYGHGSNINGPWVSFSGTLLMDQNNPRATMAMGLPYMSFACRYSDGMPTSYMMLHIVHIIGSGPTIELNGGWRVLYTDVGMKTDIAGDDNAWYCVYSQQEFLYVDKGSIIGGQSQYTDLGSGFRYNNPVSNPEIVVYNGQPVVAWIENGGTELLVAEWNGTEWLLIGYDEISEGNLSSIRMTSYSTDLYVIYLINDAEVNISLNHWDGTNWYGLPSIQDQLNTNVGTADIAIYGDEPVVAFTENNQLKVKIYSSSGFDIASLSLDQPLISCFPNPIQNDFNIDLGNVYKDVYLKITDITGKLILEKEYKTTKILHGSLEAVPGVYLFEVYSNDERIGQLKVLKN